MLQYIREVPGRLRHSFWIVIIKNVSYNITFHFVHSFYYVLFLWFYNDCFLFHFNLNYFSVKLLTFFVNSKQQFFHRCESFYKNSVVVAGDALLKRFSSRFMFIVTFTFFKATTTSSQSYFEFVIGFNFSFGGSRHYGFHIFSTLSDDSLTYFEVIIIFNLYIKSSKILDVSLSIWNIDIRRSLCFLWFSKICWNKWNWSWAEFSSVYLVSYWHFRVFFIFGQCNSVRSNGFKL